MSNIRKTDEGKKKQHETDSKSKSKTRQHVKMDRETAFDEVEGRSMVDPSILDTHAYKIIEKDFLDEISEGPEYKCEICICWNYKKSVLRLNFGKYDKEIFEKSYKGKLNASDENDLWICNSCDKSLKNKKMPPKAYANNLELNPKYKELEDLCPIELMLISQIIPFMTIVGKQRGSQHGLKGQCVLVPADMSKVQDILPRTCDDNVLISLNLKRRLSDRHYVSRQNIRPAFVNKALDKLKEVNPLYKDVRIDKTWENLSKESDPSLWNLLTNENAENVELETDSDDEENDKTNKANEKNKTPEVVRHPTVLHNLEGPSILPEQVVNIAPGEGQIPVYHSNEENWEALAFPKMYSHGKNHFNSFRDIRLTPSKYAHARLKCSDDRFASSTQYIFHCLDWVEKEAVSSSINIAQRKHFQGNLTAGQVNSGNVLRWMSDNQLFATFKNIRGTPQYMHNMNLDVLAKVRAFNVNTLFLTVSWTELHRPEIIKIVARQYGTMLSDDEILQMTFEQKSMWLKRNPVTVARHFNHCITAIFGRKVIFSGMHPIGQILNVDCKNEFQDRGNEHLHAAIHIVDAPKIDVDDDNKITEFIDKYITCSIPDKNEYPDLYQLVKSVQTHGHRKTCEKKKGVRCRFNAPWPPSDKTCIVRGTDFSKEKQEESKKVLDKVLSQLERPDVCDLTLQDVLDESGVTEEQYDDALEVMNNKLSIVYKRKPNEGLISPYNTVLLSLLKSNMNLQFVTGIYGMISYLTKYLCKPEDRMSELMKKVSKEASNHDIRAKLRKIGNVFLTKREVSTHEAIIRLLSLPMRSSNIAVIFIPTGFQEHRTRLLKPLEILNTLDPDDPNIFCTNFLDRYANRPNELEHTCYADFATNYKPTNADKNLEPDDIESYTEPITNIETLPNSDVAPTIKNGKIIVLKNKLGKMRKRTFPCIMRYHKGSKLKDSEHYYMTLLQLYMPWRNESNLKEGYSTYEEKFKQVESDILPNISSHDCFYGVYDDDEDLMNNAHQSTNEDEENIIDSEFGMLNPALLDLDMPQDNGQNNNVVPSTVVENISLSREEFYENCSQLNEGQQHLFNFIMKYAQQLMLNSKNDLPYPDPFNIFLTGGAGVGKSFLVNCITEYMKKTLKFPGQNYSEEPSIAVTASTGKAATNVNGTTLHSAFKLPVKLPGVKVRTKPTDDDLTSLRKRYKNLKTVLIDEISMTDKFTFDCLNRWLRIINKRDDFDFGSVSILVIGDFFQLPPGNQQYIFKNLTPTDAWYNFEMHELVDIVRQIGDPHFAQLLNRLREDNQTNEDIEDIKAMEHVDISAWPEDHVCLYLTNNLKDKHNNASMNKLLEEDASRKLYTFNAIDSKTDSKTGAIQVNVDPKLPITKTGGLPSYLKVCIGATVMLTYNKDQHDRLINGSIGTVINIQSRLQEGPASGTIYVKFEDEKAGSKYKDVRLRGDLKQCVPITVRTNKFPLARSNNVWVERKQFPLVTAHALTIHKSQGSTMQYMTGDMDRTTKTGSRSTPIYPGQFYTLLSRARSRDTVRILNFNKDNIIVSEIVKAEMKRMRRDCVFSWKHPLLEIEGTKICLLNIVSWNLHIPHFLSDKYYINHSNVFCFTETHTNNTNFKRIEEYHQGWKSIHHPSAEHGLAICYNAETVVIEKEFPEILMIEMLPVLMNIDGELVLLILVYRPPGGQRDVFIYQLLQQLSMIDEIHRYRTIVLGDFNTDQMLQENVNAYQQLCDRYNFTQRSRYSTHIQGGILDLVFDQKKTETVQWMPSPYSDHFVLIVDM